VPKKPNPRQPKVGDHIRVDTSVSSDVSRRDKLDGKLNGEEKVLTLCSRHNSAY
jgi:hypothetical protein